MTITSEEMKEIKRRLAGSPTETAVAASAQQQEKTYSKEAIASYVLTRMTEGKTMGRKAHEDWYREQREKREQGDKGRQDNRRDIADYQTERWQRRAAEAKSGPLALQELASCLICGRKTWAAAEVGKPCNMPQPDGSKCEGAMSSPRPSDGGQEWTTEPVLKSDGEAWLGLSYINAGTRRYGSLNDQQAKAICVAHNASLAAEREEIAIIGRSRDAWKSQVTNLSEALTAEREKFDLAVIGLRDFWWRELNSEREKREQAERNMNTFNQSMMQATQVAEDYEKQLDAALDGWARESQRADDAEAACGENCKTIAKLTKELATAVGALQMIMNDRSAGPIRGIARGALAKMGERKEV